MEIELKKQRYLSSIVGFPLNIKFNVKKVSVNKKSTAKEPIAQFLEWYRAKSSSYCLQTNEETP